MRVQCLALLVASSLFGYAAAERRQGGRFAANPIRKVVTMLQMMQKKVQQEGEAEKELYEKFMCYCKTSGDDLTKAIQTAEEKVPQMESGVKEAEEQKSQLEATLKEAKESRAGGKKTLAEALQIREKEASVYAASKADYEANIGAIDQAVAALEKGSGGSFLQSTEAGRLQRVVLDTTTSSTLDEARDVLMNFLQAKDDSQYAPQSGQISGILKQLGDEMRKNLDDATAAENTAIKTFEELETAKKKEVEVLGSKIESCLTRIGELGVTITQLKDDAADTKEALAADKEFLATLEEGCSTKTAEWEERQKIRADELVALSETVKILNDDDALELFKKTLPSQAASFMQVPISASAMRSEALSVLQEVQVTRHAPGRVQLDLIALALNGKKVGFEKVVGMIDTMVTTLKKEQDADDKKKDYCTAEFDTADDKKKALERSMADSQTAIEQAKDSIATLTEEAAALTTGIKELDASVSEATAQRKRENKEYSELMAANGAAKELLDFAKNRLNKFYNPKLYKPPPKNEMSEGDQIYSNMGGDVPTPAPGGIANTGVTVFAQVSQHRQRAFGAPPPPPDTFDAYTKKTEGSNGVVAMMDLLIKDLDKELTAAEVEEKNGQKAYEVLMADSANKRAADSKSLTQKEKSKANMEAELEVHKDGKASSAKELKAANNYIMSLHQECDWLMQYYSMRKEARDSEIDALGKAKAVLSGADYS